MQTAVKCSRDLNQGPQALKREQRAGVCLFMTQLQEGHKDMKAERFQSPYTGVAEG